MKHELQTPAGSFRRQKRLGTGVLLGVGIAAYTAAYLADRDERAPGRSPVPGANWVYAPARAVEEGLARLTRQDARRIVADALSEAGRSDRKVLLVFGTENCLPCRQMERFLDQQEQTLSDHFIVVKVVYDVMENGKAVHHEYRRPPEVVNGGLYIPWSCVLDSNGNRVVTSDGPDGTIGLPQGGAKGRAWFMQMLRRADAGLTEEELATIDRAAARYHDEIWKN